MITINISISSKNKDVYNELWTTIKNAVDDAREADPDVESSCTSTFNPNK